MNLKEIRCEGMDWRNGYNWLTDFV